MPTPDDYDNPWKQALEQAFPEFVAFYFPDAARRIDWSRGHTFLDKELQQIARDAELGRRHVDKLVSVFTFDGSEDWICIHVEVQGRHDRVFARRMFVYNYRIFDRYDRPVASLAVLADDDPHWRPDRFGFELLGCCHSLTYPVAKLIDRKATSPPCRPTPTPSRSSPLPTCSHGAPAMRPTTDSRPSAASCACSTSATGARRASSASSPSSTG